MLKQKRALVINASPDAVWQVLARFMHVDEIAPGITKVEALTTGPDQTGSKRRCHFENGSWLDEEVTEWQPGRGYRVRLSELNPLPLKSAEAYLRISPEGSGRSRVEWGMEFRMKYGPFGWLLGQAAIKPVMGKVLNGNLQALEQKLQSRQAA